MYKYIYKTSIYIFLYVYFDNVSNNDLAISIKSIELRERETHTLRLTKATLLIKLFSRTTTRLWRNALWVGQ